MIDDWTDTSAWIITAVLTISVLYFMWKNPFNLPQFSLPMRIIMSILTPPVFYAVVKIQLDK